jgi:hypothetical protein
MFFAIKQIKPVLVKVQAVTIRVSLRIPCPLEAFPMNVPEFDPEAIAGNKVVRTFRMPRDLVNVLGKEAAQRGLDMTALVLRVLHGYLTYFSLPEAAIALLEADREALKMDRNQYLSHLLYHRCLALRESGLGFDDPRRPELMPRRPSAAAEAPAQPVPEEAKVQPRLRPLGAAGGGTHNATEGLVPGTGVWPSFAIQEGKPQKR